ncbi:MAG: response regulator transcription factor [Candidatus Pelagibacterales bacterium]|nr:MAG: response regulator transcription factor [Pelagibacterales bacterium]
MTFVFQKAFFYYNIHITLIMNEFTISIIGNKIFYEIINEIKLFSKYKIKFYENSDLFNTVSNSEKYIALSFENSLSLKIINQGNILEKIKMPFKILDFEKKIILSIAKSEFKSNSLINLSSYVIDKNERKIKKNGVQLKLSEKEINFLILFNKSSKPISRNLVLRKVWNYSPETQTHTVETHIHRLRKKILEKFGDDNFIKNNNEGYYI